MKSLKSTFSTLRPSVVLFLPLVLWVLVWAGVKGGLVQEIFDSDDFFGAITRSRAILPILAAGFALIMIFVSLSKQRSGVISFFGPLGFATVYGVAGLAAALLSPDGSVALYWAAAYLSVPLVLWGVVWGKDGLGAVDRIISLNWLIIILAVVALFVAALLYLDLGALILTPSSWFDCPLYGRWQGHSWLDFSSGFLRPSGVARYAALAAIISLAGLWQGRWRSLWVAIILVSLILLLTSGSRGAFIGFAAGASAVILLYGSKKGLAGAALTVLVIGAALWSTGAHDRFLDACILRGADTARFTSSETVQPPELIALELSVRVTIPDGAWTLEEVAFERQADLSGSVEESPSLDKEILLGVFTKVLIPAGLSIEMLSPTHQAANAKLFKPVKIPGGVWELKPLVARETDLDGAPIRVAVPTGPVLFTTRDPEIGAFTGRASVWQEGYRLFKEQPVLGYGFHADRLILGTHMHNTFMHALVQTGLIGTVPFVIGLLFAWMLLLKALWNRAVLSQVHKHLLIQVAGVLVFFSFRAIPESTGAFFGVDWLVLAPILLYLQIVNQTVFKLKMQDHELRPQEPVLGNLRFGGIVKSPNIAALLRRFVNRPNPVAEVP